MTVNPEVLAHDVRAFVPSLPGGVTLGTIGRWFKAGDTLQLGSHVTKTFDHRDEIARPVLNIEGDYFVLEVELIHGSNFRPPVNPYLTVKPV